jgi:hypothetical protein
MSLKSAEERKRARERGGDHSSEEDEDRKKQVAVLQQRLGYTDEDNPFGDRDLAKPFVWKLRDDVRTLHSLL